MKHDSILVLENVSKSFRQGGETIHALNPTKFSAKKGKVIAIIGPSGSGKSTLLTILGGLQTPTRGKVYIAGQDITQASEKQRATVRLRHVGFILQSSNLVPYLTVYEQLALYDKASSRKFDVGRADGILKELGIYKLRNKYPSDLSGGEQQRAAIARALYSDAEILLADEPTASLDSKRALEVAAIIASEARKMDRVAILVTHDERLLTYCDEVYYMNDGTLTKR